MEKHYAVEINPICQDSTVRAALSLCVLWESETATVVWIQIDLFFKVGF